MEQQSGELKPEFDIFISYAAADKLKAFEVCESLEARGVKCWIAPRNAKAGGEYTDETMRGIESAASLVVVLSDAANESNFVAHEVERAVVYGKPVFPFRIEDVQPTAELELFVSNAHWIDAWHGNLLEHIDKVINELNAVHAKLSPTKSDDSAPIHRKSWFGVMRRR